MDQDVTRAHAIVRGRVQGVYFRAATQRQAAESGLSGWVRNGPEGVVELVFEGPRAAVERGLAWAAVGPPASRVDHVETSWEDPIGERGFAIR